jgi:hypothetical protein
MQPDDGVYPVAGLIDGASGTNFNSFAYGNYAVIEYDGSVIKTTGKYMAGTTPAVFDPTVLWNKPGAATGTEERTVTPAKYGVPQLQAFPTPFNPGTTFQVTQGISGAENQVSVSEGTIFVYTVNGQRMARMPIRFVQGRASVFWNGSDRNGRPVPNGVYLIRYIDQKYQSETRVVVQR